MNMAFDPLKRRDAYLTLGVLLLISACLRFYGLGWGTDARTDVFHRLHPDEATMVDGASLVGVDLHKVTAPYGKMPMYILAAVARAAGYVAGVAPFDLQDNRSVRFTHMVGRGISAALGTLTVWVAFGIGCRLGGGWTGVLGAIFLAVSPGHIQQSHYYTVDASFTFWASLAVYLMLRMPSRHSWIYILCGVACGMAGGTRLLGVVLGVPFVLAVLWPEEGESWTWHRLRRLVAPRVVVCGLLAVFITLVGEPYLVLDPEHFFGRDDLRRFTMAMDVASGEIVRIWSLYDFTTTPYLFYVTHLLRYALGTPLEIAALLGVALALRLRPRGWWVLLGWLGIYFLLVGRLHTKPIRYVTPMLPVLTALGAWACVRGGDWLRRRTGKTWTLALPAVLAGTPAVVYGTAMMRIYTVDDSRFQAAQWVETHIPKGSGVLAEHGGFPTAWMVSEYHYYRKTGPGSAFLRMEGYFPGWAQIDFVKQMLSGTDWIVLTEENRMRQYLAVPDRYPVGCMLYQRLISGALGFERVASFKVSPGIPGWQMPDDGAEPTVTAFDHPRVSVYRRAEADLQPLIEQWEADLLADPRLPDRDIKAGVAAYRRQNWEQALGAFRRAVALRPGAILGQMLIREVYLRQGRQEEAKQLLAEIDAQSVRPQEALAGMVHAGLKAEGAAYLEHYIKNLRPSDRGYTYLKHFAAKTRYDLGAEAQEQGRADDAKTQYARSVELNPGYAPALANLGSLHLEEQRNEEAERFLKRASELDSTCTAVHVNLGILHYRLGRYAEAVSAFGQAARYAPDDTEIHVGLAQTYEKMGRTEDAARAYRRILAIDPAHAGARKKLEARLPEEQVGE